MQLYTSHSNYVIMLGKNIRLRCCIDDAMQVPPSSNCVFMACQNWLDSRKPEVDKLESIANEYFLKMPESF